MSDRKLSVKEIEEGLRNAVNEFWLRWETLQHSRHEIIRVVEDEDNTKDWRMKLTSDTVRAARQVLEQGAEVDRLIALFEEFATYHAKDNRDPATWNGVQAARQAVSQLLLKIVSIR